MGYTKHIYIQDEEIIKFINRENNFSKLINNLLKEYYQNQEKEILTLEDKKKMLALKKIELDALRKKAEVLDNGNF